MSEQINVPGLLEAKQQASPAPTSNKVVVSAFNDLVVLHLDQPQEYLPFNAIGAVDTATRMLAIAAEADRTVAQIVINVALFLIDHVYEIRGDLKPSTGAAKQEAVDRHRRKLTKRLEVMLNSAREDRTKPNPVLAKEMVEACLREVF